MSDFLLRSIYINKISVVHFDKKNISTMNELLEFFKIAVEIETSTITSTFNPTIYENFHININNNLN
jgi:hypothetical protein